MLHEAFMVLRYTLISDYLHTTRHSPTPEKFCLVWGIFCCFVCFGFLGGLFCLFAVLGGVGLVGFFFYCLPSLTNCNPSTSLKRQIIYPLNPSEAAKEQEYFLPFWKLHAAIHAAILALFCKFDLKNECIFLHLPLHPAKKFLRFTQQKMFPFPPTVII